MSKSIIDLPLDFVVLDLETTGRSCNTDDIIEFAAIRVRNGKAVDTMQTLVNPGCFIGNEITDLTGITNIELTAAPALDEVVDKMKSFIGEDILIGHNIAGFDSVILARAFGSLTNPVVDTLRLSKKLLPSVAHRTLGNVADALGVSVRNAHRALSDCETTLDCYLSLRKIALDEFGSCEKFALQFADYADYDDSGSAETKKHNGYNKYVSVKGIKSNKTEFDESNPFFGKICVFTGTLLGLSREQAAQIVVDCGGTCADNLTKKTSFLIIGDDGNGEKSGKQRKADEYISKGCEIQILNRAEFLSISGYNLNNEIAEETTDLLEIQKSLGLTPKSFIEVKQLYYRGVYTNGRLMRCEFVRQVSNAPQIVTILVNGSERNIALDYLKEMQPTQSEAENYVVDDEVYSDESVLNQVVNLIDERYRASCVFSINQNSEKVSYCSICVKLKTNVYNSIVPGTSVLARVKTTGNAYYISFNQYSKKALDKYGIQYSKPDSDTFYRVDLDYFFRLCASNTHDIGSALNVLLLNSFNFPSFGCCSRYKECSAKKECIHEDYLYASAACQYKQHLDAGENYYINLK